MIILVNDHRYLTWLVLWGVLLLGCAPPTDLRELQAAKQFRASPEPAAGSQDQGLAIPPLQPSQGLDPGRVALGRSLFFDKRLSQDNSIACATCHDLTSGGVDGRKLAIGIHGQQGKFNTPTVFNSSLSFAQFWDGRVATLQEQVAGPVHNLLEMGSNWEEVLAKLNADPTLVQEFGRAYAQGLTKETIADAIATFEQSLITLNAPFDRYLSGERDAISAQALAGYHLFQEIGCIACHQGQAVGGNMFQEFGVMALPRQQNLTQAAFTGSVKAATSKPSQRFKVPGLRNVALTGPYFHDGSATTLAQAILVMGQVQLGIDLELEEVQQIQAFMVALTGEAPASATHFPRKSRKIAPSKIKRHSHEVRNP